MLFCAQLLLDSIKSIIYLIAIIALLAWSAMKIALPAFFVSQTSSTSLQKPHVSTYLAQNVQSLAAVGLKKSS